MSEEKQKLSFLLKGKKFAYEGFPQNKERDLFDFMVKMKAPDDIVIETFKSNLPELVNLSDEEIWSRFAAAKEAKARAKAEKEKAKHLAAQQAEVNSVGVAQEPPAPTPPATTQTSTPPAPTQNNAPRKETEQPQQPPMHFTDSLSAEEKADIKDFIDKVVHADREDLVSKIKSAPAPTNTTTTTNVAPDPRRQSVSATEHEGGEKVVVYLNMEGTDSNKIIHVPPSIPFDEFMALVEKKFGLPLVLSFVDGEDKIEVDDDDGLGYFFEQEVKRRKMTCSMPDTRRKIVDDSLTTQEKDGKESSLKTAGSATEISKKDAPNTSLHKEIRTYTGGHSGPVYCCAFAPNGDRFVTASRDRSVRVWNVQEGDNKPMKGGHNGFVLSCDFSYNAVHCVSSSDDTHIKLWDSTTQSKVYTLKGHDDKVYCTKFNPSGEYIVSASMDKTLRVWNCTTGSKISLLKGHTLSVFSCCFGNQDAGKFVASASDDRLVKIWDWRDQKEVKSLIGHTGTVWSCRFSHDDKYIVSASMDHEIKLWDVGMGQVIKTFSGHMTPIHDALFSANDKCILSCARDWTVVVWDTLTGESIDTLTGHRHTVYHMDLQADKLLTCSMDETIKLWNFNHDVEEKKA